MEGLKNLLELLNAQWPTISACIILIFALYTKAKKLYIEWQEKTEKEKQAAIDLQIANARSVLKDVILGFVSKAEIDWNYDSPEKFGVIKRSSVIEEIYSKYPILLQVADKEELLREIDLLIDEALVTVREKIRTN